MVIIPEGCHCKWSVPILRCRCCFLLLFSLNENSVWWNRMELYFPSAMRRARSCPACMAGDSPIAAIVLPTVPHHLLPPEGYYRLCTCKMQFGSVWYSSGSEQSSCLPSGGLRETSVWLSGTISLHLLSPDMMSGSSDSEKGIPFECRLGFQLCAWNSLEITRRLLLECWALDIYFKAVADSKVLVGEGLQGRGSLM